MGNYFNLISEKPVPGVRSDVTVKRRCLVPQEHKRFVNGIRFSPDGALLCSVSSDCKAVLYDGGTGEVKGSLGGDKAHNGGVYAVSPGVCRCDYLTCVCVCVMRRCHGARMASSY